jgi:hypothetical protein
MLDIVRVIVLLAAIVQAIRHRFVLRIVFGIVMLGGFAVLAVATYFALSHHAIGGEYGFAFVYVGPSMLPFGQRDWLPTVVQCVLAALSAVPAVSALRSPLSPVATPFLVVFVPNAMLAVLTALATFLLWHQKVSFPQYWQNP